MLPAHSQPLQPLTSPPADPREERAARCAEYDVPHDYHPVRREGESGEVLSRAERGVLDQAQTRVRATLPVEK